MFKYLIALSFIVSTLSCTSEKNDDESSNTVNTKIQKPSKVDFFYEKLLSLEEMYGPKIKIGLNIDGKRYFIEEGQFPSLGKMNSENQEMITNNLASAGSWWAGAGANYAAFWKDGEVIIKKEIIEELPEELIVENPDLAIPQIKIIKKIKLSN